MHAEASYVVYTYKQNHWDVESSFPEENQALSEARMMFDEAVYTGVRVIREGHADTDGKAQSKTIFQKIKKTEIKKTAQDKTAEPERLDGDAHLFDFLNAPITRTLIILTLTLVIGAGIMVYVRAVARGM